MTQKLKTEVIHGTGIGEACTMGKLRFLHTRTQKNEQKGCGIEAERTRLRDAIAFVLQNLAELQ